MKTVFFIINRRLNTAEVLPGFSCFEQIQGAFRCGFIMSDGNPATGIGQCRNMADFKRRAAHSKVKIL